MLPKKDVALVVIPKIEQWILSKPLRTWRTTSTHVEHLSIQLVLEERLNL